MTHADPLEQAAGLAQKIQATGGRALIVGGAARDEAFRRMGRAVQSKDIDLEVFGIAPENLHALLAEEGNVDRVGAAFKVWKLGPLDISIPRSESKTGPGHKGFEVTGDPSMLFEDAARRRDLTINALGFDPLTGELIDAFGGLRDLECGILRAVDRTRFGDDPLRVLRIAQFAARFEFSIDPQTTAIAQMMPLHELADERIAAEWHKLLLRAKKPGLGLMAMRELGVLAKLHPEIDALIDTPQDPDWHPEGDVFTHTVLVLDAAATIAEREQLGEDERQQLLLAALCHDLGKPSTTAFIDGRWRARGHAEAGEQPARQFLRSLCIRHSMVDPIVKLVREHLWPSQHFDVQIGRFTVGDPAIRRLAVRLDPASIEDLILLAEADRLGRGDPNSPFPEGHELRTRARMIEVDQRKPTPILMGRHLIELGLEPGPDFSTIIERVYQAQIDGRVTDLRSATALAKGFANAATR